MTSEQVKYIMDKMFRFEVSKYGKGSLDPYFLGYCRCLVELRSKIIDEERKEMNHDNSNY